MSYTFRAKFEFPGANIYMLLFNSAGLCWNGSEFVAFTGDNSVYAQAATETPAASSTYVVTIYPNPPPDDYEEEFWERVGATADRSADWKLGIFQRSWAGGMELPLELVSLGPHAGSTKWVYKATDPHKNPMPGVFCLVCTDTSGRYPIAVQTTDYRGWAEFKLDTGSYYFFRKKVGHDFTNPIRITVT